MFGFLKTLLQVLCILIAFYFIGGYLMFWKADYDNEAALSAMKESDFSCPDDSEIRVTRGAKLGYTRDCKPNSNNRWEHWEAGYKSMDGEYVNGRRHGEAYRYNSNGNVISVFKYEHGSLVSGGER